MTESGGIRYDFWPSANIKPNEDRTLRIPVYDAAGVLVTDFTGWTFGFTAFPDGQPYSAPLASYTLASGIVATAPNADVSLRADDTAAARKVRYAYELWRTDAGHRTCLAYGLLM